LSEPTAGNGSIPALNDGPAAPSSEPQSAIAAYTRVHEEEQPRLVAYARSLTGNPWVAEDLVAEAHFRVWRRLPRGTRSTMCQPL
jgi:DNA-directed RNA polymerase specialized sigma24 family protein